jgi:hypothetical protein
LPETLPGAGIAVDGDVIYGDARLGIAGQVKRREGAPKRMASSE